MAIGLRRRLSIRLRGRLPVGLGEAAYRVEEEAGHRAAGAAVHRAEGEAARRAEEEAGHMAAEAAVHRAEGEAAYKVAEEAGHRAEEEADHKVEEAVLHKAEVEVEAEVGVEAVPWEPVVDRPAYQVAVPDHPMSWAAGRCPGRHGSCCKLFSVKTFICFLNIWKSTIIFTKCRRVKKTSTYRSL